MDSDSHSPMSEANNQIEQEILSKHSSDVEAPAADDDDNNNYNLTIMAEQDRDYGCRYCQKKFSNKQALGGHQNAHKVERAMEKNVQETGFFAAAHLPYHARMSIAAAAPYHRQPEFHHRRLYSWNYGGGGGVPYNPRPPVPRLPAFPIRPHYSLPVDIRLANFGPGSSNAFRSGAEPGFPDFPPEFGIRLGGKNGAGAPINLRNVPKVVHDDSGMDLSLRLGYDHL